MADLWVYRLAPPHVLTGDLWDFRYGELAGEFPLPFTYPPFAALVLLPLSYLPWFVLQCGWLVLSLVALWLIVRRSFALVSGEPAGGHPDPALARRWRDRAVLCTAVMVWIEPVYSTLNFGQVNLFLAAGVLMALCARRPWVAGGGIGLAAGIKLLPAVSGAYFLLRRRWAAAAWSVLFFLSTIGVSYLVAPSVTAEYFTSILGDASRVGPVGSAINQSLRGALTRSAGYDVGSGPAWLIAVAAALGLALLAARAAVRAGDTLALIVTVALFGLLASPVSWSHHWVWLVPLLIWLGYGPARQRRASWAAIGLWALLAGSFLIKWLIKAQPTIWTIPRPWYLAALGWGYPVGGLVALAAIWLGLRAIPAHRRVDAQSAR